MTSLIVVGAIALFVLITVLKGVRIVPQGEEWIVERLGRYHSTLKPGLNIVIPYMDVVATACRPRTSSSMCSSRKSSPRTTR